MEITATVDQSLRLKDPFNGRDFESDITLERSGDELLCQLKKGQTLRLISMGAPR